MKEAVILQSPHAVDPMETLTEKEKAERYRTRLDETFRPYTVIDVLTKVYHRRFEDDLRQSAGERPEDFLEPENGWRVSRVWVNGCRIVRVETLFFQPLSDFQMDLFARVSLRMELVRGGDAGMTRYKSLRTELRLRYSLNLRPCKLTCRFVKTVVKEEDGLLARNPMAIRADKYLLPILHESDYPRLARWILSQYDMTENGLPLDVDLLAMRMGLKLLPGRFSEKGVTGEIYFNHGRAEILDPATGEARDTNIDPGTIILNLAACTTRGMLRVTLLHECVHHLLADRHFLLQMTHGHQYCSYLCKKKDETHKERGTPLSPADIMEIQANKLPGYLLIDAESGKARAKEFLASCRDKGSDRMRRLVRDMAEYYGATLTTAGTRLQALGYPEVRGVLQSANGKLVPAFLSDLKDGQTYMIDHIDALKEYVRNAAFREALDTGRYVYCEGHFCLNDPRYIRPGYWGKPYLSAYARDHMRECCLIFETAYENTLKRLVSGVLQKARGDKKKVRYVSFDGGSAVTAEGRKFRDRITAEYREIAAMQPSFQEMLTALIERRKFTKTRLAEETGLSEDTIRRMKNEPDRVQDIRAVLAVCIALHLPGELSRQMIALSTAKFHRSEEMYAYEYVLEHCYQWKVGAVNRFLVEAGFRPLTGLVDGYDEDGVRMEE